MIKNSNYKIVAKSPSYIVIKVIKYPLMLDSTKFRCIIGINDDGKLFFNIPNIRFRIKGVKSDEEIFNALKQSNFINPLLKVYRQGDMFLVKVRTLDENSTKKEIAGLILKMKMEKALREIAEVEIDALIIKEMKMKEENTVEALIKLNLRLNPNLQALLTKDLEDFVWSSITRKISEIGLIIKQSLKSHLTKSFTIKITQELEELPKPAVHNFEIYRHKISWYGYPRFMKFLNRNFTASDIFRNNSLMERDNFFDEFGPMLPFPLHVREGIHVVHLENFDPMHRLNENLLGTTLAFISTDWIEVSHPEHMPLAIKDPGLYYLVFMQFDIRQHMLFNTLRLIKEC